MKKYGSLIALAVVVILAAVFVATRDKPVAKVRAPYSIAKVENLTRIELTRPGDQLVVLEKADSDWEMTRPVEAPLAENTAKELDEAFAAKINTDDLPVASDQPETLELDEENAVKVALFTEGASTPSAEFFVGKAIQVPGTRAERTFIKTPDGKFYRAQTDLGETLRREVNELRSRQVQRYDRDAISELQVTYSDERVVHIKKAAEDWELVAPETGIALESGRVSAFVNNFANLVATGFVDDRAPAELGLAPPYAEVVGRVDGEAKRLLVSAEVEGEKKFYVKTPDSPLVYEISSTTGDALTPTVNTLRNRLALDVKPDAITRVAFGGSDRVIVEKVDGAWKFGRGGRGAVKESALSSRLTTLGQLRAIRFEEKSLAEAGLDKPFTSVSFDADGETHTLLVGSEADHKSNRYAKWKDSDLIMVVPPWVGERANTKASDLQEDET